MKLLFFLKKKYRFTKIKFFQKCRYLPSISKENLKKSKEIQKTSTLPLLPSTSFLSTLHSDLDFVPNKEELKYKITVTDNNIELSFEVDCTRVRVKTQTTSLTLPKDLWRT